MTLLGFGDGLLAHRRESFTRVRRGTEAKDPSTGSPIPVAPQTATIRGWLTWMSAKEAADYKGDAAAFILTTPAQLEVGDIIEGARGKFVVLDVKPQGGHDRADLRRA